MTTFEVGQQITMLEQYHELPVGTILMAYGTSYCKDHDGIYEGSSNVWSPEQIIENRPTISVIGTVEPEPETLQRYQQRFSTIAWGRARQSGVSTSPVETAFEKLEVEWPPVLRSGMWLHSRDDTTLEVIPTGTILVSGLPDQWENQSVVTKVSSGLVNLLGARQPRYGTAYRVLSFPEGTETQPWDEPTENERERFEAWQRAAYDLGFRAKSTNGWCSDFENAMGRMWLDRSVYNRLRQQGPTPASMPAVGSRLINRQQADTLPVGTVIVGNRRWTRQEDGRWVSDAGAIRLSDGTGMGLAWSNLTVESYPASIPEGAALGGVVTRAQMEEAVSGSRILQTIISSGPYEWEKDGDGPEGIWRPTSRSQGGITGNSEGFTVEPLRWQRFGPTGTCYDDSPFSEQDLS